MYIILPYTKKARQSSNARLIRGSKFSDTKPELGFCYIQNKIAASMYTETGHSKSEN